MGETAMQQITQSATKLLLAAIVITGFHLPGNHLFAHCDGLDGPVVTAARLALDEGDVTPVLMWVTKEHEREIRDAFALTLAVREKGKEARELADQFFFETLVRLHRAGEGAPYTGLKPAGTVEPAITAADSALQTGSVEIVADKMANAVRDGIKRRFSEAADRKKHAADSVDAGRKFVEAYVHYVHFVEGIDNLIAKGAEHRQGEDHDH
jgi:hypothetical protein